DPQQYRDVTRYQVSSSLDKLFLAGVPMRFTSHQGLNHGKLFLLYNQGLSVFASANWTVPSASSQHEHNYFAKNPPLFTGLVDFFERRGNTPGPSAEARPFVPLAPDPPPLQPPASGASGVGTNVTLKWAAGFCPYFYDISFGTDPNPPLYRANVN